MDFVISQKGKRILLPLFFGLAVAVILLAVMLTGNKEGYRTIKVVEVSGKVGVVNNGMEYEAYPGMVVEEGYAIVTSSDSYVRMVLDGDKYIKLEGGSRIVLEKLGVLGSGKTAINLERGTITNEIVYPLKEAESYVINTPNAVLAVRGTFFKVELNVTEEGDTTTDVLTFGGAVSSKRIMPDGKIVDEDVVVDSGYMTTVKMSTEETIYVVESVDSDRENTTPIIKEMISDEDMIDIYFAAENGHELFITKEEIEEELKEREIDIKEHTSVYSTVVNLDKGDAITAPDDGEPLVKEEDTESVVQDQGAPSDGVHKHKKTETIEEATCTTDGKITISCSTCGELISERVLVATGHTEGEPTVTVEATCTEDGMKIICCIDCNEQLSQEVIAKTGHSEEIKIVGVTCTTPGKETVSCGSCGVLISEREIPATGHINEVDGGTAGAHIKCADCGISLSTAHDYTDTVTKQPTCTEEGERTYSCNCGYNYTTDIEATGHIHEVAGGTAGVHIKCADCGTVLSTNHSYTDNVIMEADCFDMGMTEHVCSCGYSFIEEFPPLGHTEEYVGGMNAHSQCSVCGNILSTTHEYTDTVTGEPNCTDVGKIEHSCACGYEYIEEIPALGHTEEYVGTMNFHSKCSVCGNILSTTHEYTDTIAIEATCTDVGEMKHICDCGYSYSEEIPSAGHLEGVGGVPDAHTKCQTCGEILSATHTYTDTVITEATCMDTGKVKHACDCGWSYTETISETGHTEGTPTVITAATCETDGQAEVRCVECNEFIRYEILTATGHRMIDESAPESACANCGTLLVAFDTTNFPDQVFYNLLKADGIDADADGLLSEAEITVVKRIDYVSSGITDVTGLQYFTDVTYLDLLGNSVSYVPCEDMTELEWLSLGYTDITSIDVTRYPQLEMLQLLGTEITTLDISNNPNLTDLNIASCSNLTTLDMSNNKELMNVQIQGTSLTELVMDGYDQLVELWANIETLETLRVSNCPNLTRLVTPYESNNALVTLEITNCPLVETVDLDDVTTTLQTIIIDSCGLTGELNLSNFWALETVSVNDCTSLIGLDVSYSSSLTSLSAVNNGLAYVNASGCDNLTAPNVSGNRYVVETQDMWVDMSGVTRFSGEKVTSVVSGGTFTDTIFNFDYDSTEIIYTYDLGNGYTAEFTIEIIDY